MESRSDNGGKLRVGESQNPASLGRFVALLPPVVILTVFFAIPMGMMIGLSFQGNGGPGWGLGNYEQIATDTLSRQALLRTIIMSALVAVCVTVLAYPIAYYLARSKSKFRSIVFAIAIAPELAGVVLRTYGWLVVLDTDGAVNSALLALGAISEPLPLLDNMFAVVVGMTHVILPFGILSLMTAIQGIDPNLERASQALGGSGLSMLRHILLPLSLPGIVSSLFVSFSLAASAYATPALLGGDKFGVLATLIYDQILFFINWPYAAALANVLLIIISLMAFFGSRVESGLKHKLAPQEIG
jgi:putative spermidine/putrescine transport system permease protein